MATSELPLPGNMGKVRQDRESHLLYCSQTPLHLVGLHNEYRTITKDVKYQLGLSLSTAMIMRQYYYVLTCKTDKQKLDMVNNSD